ncbi:hypothetical protein PV11_01607 [Exophiala sideris]|uniref:Xylanolytic transcriptional activator regulatory domain-containing protein n=1 Tax=Exophiala sideris TaxID=1016849 RepID=A0A0D1YWR3_9EURO|nr:hypothetical protein PV11_01607 [Exophiala sideris]
MSRPDDFFDVQRIEAMETLLQHFTGCTTLDKETLARLVGSVQDEHCSSKMPTPIDVRDDALGPEASNDDEYYTIDPVSLTTAVYTGDLSHSHFSANFRRKLKEGLRDSDIESLHGVAHSTDPDRASRLYSNSSIVATAAGLFPPKEVASFLIDTFFEYGQTNYSYIDEQTLREKLDRFYASPKSINTCDSSWVCTALMLFAVGTQFAHLSSTYRDDGEKGSKTSEVEMSRTLSPDDSTALKFYHAAKRLMSDVIAIASVESVQAFLMFGMYTLPLHPDGLAYTYFGVALRLATLNGMHRSLRHRAGIGARSAEIRNRIWWTTYTLERRVCALHGRPVSVSNADVDAEAPSDFPALRSQKRIDIIPNFSVMIRLTAFLEAARDKLYVTCIMRDETFGHGLTVWFTINMADRSLWRKTMKRTTASGSSLDSIWRLKQDLHCYWQSLPSGTRCRDLTPHRQLFRLNTHLALTYHLAHIFIGRTFIFSFPQGSATVTPTSTQEQTRHSSSELRDDLVNGSIQSALSVVDLCQTLKNEGLLARASYTEFTTCWAALLVILAQRMHEPSARLRMASEQGLKLIKSMSLGIYGASAEKMAIEAMETALRRLDEGATTHQQGNPIRGNPVASSYDQFRSWAMLWKNESGDVMHPSPSNVPVPPTELPVSLDAADFANLEPLQDLGWDMYSPSFPFEFGDFNPSQ